VTISLSVPKQPGIGGNPALSNPWVQSIGGGLIVALIVGLVSFALKRRREALFSISVSTVIFVFGNILEPATKSVLEGPFGDEWVVSAIFRYFLPTTFFITLFIAGFIPGTLTGLLILRARSFRQRIEYGAFWAVVSLTLFDAAMYYSTFYIGGPLAPKIATWSNVYFSLICDIFGGAIGGVIIGSLLHLFVEVTHKRRTHEPETEVKRIATG
jgi:hypothetical protein